MRRSWLRVCWVCIANSVTGIGSLLNADFYLERLIRMSPHAESYQVHEALRNSACAALLILGIVLEVRLSRWASVVNVGIFGFLGVSYFYDLVGEHWATFDRRITPT